MIINCKVKDNSKTPVAIETTEVVALEGFLISESGHSGMEVGSEASSLYKEKMKNSGDIRSCNKYWLNFFY